MSRIQAEIQAIRQELPEGVRLVAVSKYHPVGALIDAYEGGQRVFVQRYSYYLPHILTNCPIIGI